MAALCASMHLSAAVRRSCVLADELARLPIAWVITDWLAGCSNVLCTACSCSGERQSDVIRRQRLCRADGADGGGDGGGERCGGGEGGRQRRFDARILWLSVDDRLALRDRLDARWPIVYAVGPQAGEIGWMRVGQ